MVPFPLREIGVFFKETLKQLFGLSSETTPPPRKKNKKKKTKKKTKKKKKKKRVYYKMKEFAPLGNKFFPFWVETFLQSSTWILM